MNDDWTAFVVSKLHTLDISQKELAKRCGYTPSYLSCVLRNRKTFSSDYSLGRTKRNILRALWELEHEVE